MSHKLTDFIPGQRVQLHPATDAWMSGDRYGVVVHVGKVRPSLKNPRVRNRATRATLQTRVNPGHGRTTVGETDEQRYLRHDRQA